jgi:protoporphyrinogen oxidase
VGSVRGENEGDGRQIEMGCKVVGCDYDAANETWTVTYREGNDAELESEHVISSAPMRELVNGLQPPVSEKRRRRPIR